MQSGAFAALFVKKIKCSQALNVVIKGDSFKKLTDRYSSGEMYVNAFEYLSMREE